MLFLCVKQSFSYRIVRKDAELSHKHPGLTVRENWGDNGGSLPALDAGGRGLESHPSDQIAGWEWQ